MIAPIIRARHVAKSYQLGAIERPPNNIREAMLGFVRKPIERFRNGGGRDELTFWALDDVSFDVRQGDILGILGRNGAGKSTLLKVLSRITEPTRGRIELRGRVASLLEVGTGFHAELTGRENVYLNGTILGMRKREIDKKFDEIVAFSGIEKFIDTPVKRYSSGMSVRLAFAVAAHLEPEILVIDEVLAVGDAEFQQKCIGKMSDVAHEGRTVLFVSHNMAALQSLCTRAIMLERGKVVMDGDVEPAIKRYLAQTKVTARGHRQLSYNPAYNPSAVTIEATELLVNGEPGDTVQSGDSCTFRLYYRLLAPDGGPIRLSTQIRLSADGQRVATLWTNSIDGAGVEATPRGILECTVPHWPIRSKQMSAEVMSYVGQREEEEIRDAFAFSSYDGDYYGTGIVPGGELGFTFIDHAWRNVPALGDELRNADSAA